MWRPPLVTPTLPALPRSPCCSGHRVRVLAAARGRCRECRGRPWKTEAPPSPRRQPCPSLDFAHGGPKPEWSAWPPQPAPWNTLPLSWALVRKLLSKYRRAGLAGEPRSRPQAGLGGGDGSFSGSGGRGVAQRPTSRTEPMWGGDKGLSGPRAGGHSGVSGDAGSASQSAWLWWRSVCSHVQGALSRRSLPVVFGVGHTCLSSAHLSSVAFFFFFSV